MNGSFRPNTGTGDFFMKFNSSPVSPDGNGFLWTLTVSGLPGTPSNGSANLFEARRTEAGWINEFLSPTPVQAEVSGPGSASGAHNYVTFSIEAFRGGSLATCDGCLVMYWVRHPDGSFHLMGEGTVPTNNDTDGYPNGFIDEIAAPVQWISPDGSHQIFTVQETTANQGKAQLTLDASPSAVGIFDRTPDGLHLVSKLPGEITPSTNSLFAGSSTDGSVVLFRNQGNLYVRIDNSETVEIASSLDGGIVSGGVSSDGSRAFFIQEGDIFYYDLEAGEVKEAASPGDAAFAYVSPDGSHVYFLSEEELVPGKGTPGSPNLYVWDGSSIQFIATVTAEDVAHPENSFFVGLKLWAEMETVPIALNKMFLTGSARTTFDGKVFIFESQAKLTDYPNEGHVEIYRYETENQSLSCVSCSPTKPTAAADSRLVMLERDGGAPPLYPTTEVPNLSANGERVVFESRDDLLPEDVNGVRDVYLWDAGELSLISTGHSPNPSGIGGVSSNADDIFITTSERLVGQSQDPGTLALYDARVNGGLASQQAVQQLPCEGEGCLGSPSSQPSFGPPGSSVVRSRGNPRQRCRHKQTHRRGKKHVSKHRSGKKKSCKSKGRRASK